MLHTKTALCTSVLMMPTTSTTEKGNSVDQLRHTKSVAYSVELVLLNKHQILGGGAYLHCYLVGNSLMFRNMHYIISIE